MIIRNFLWGICLFILQCAALIPGFGLYAVIYTPLLLFLIPLIIFAINYFFSSYIQQGSRGCIIQIIFSWICAAVMGVLYVFFISQDSIEVLICFYSHFYLFSIPDAMCIIVLLIKKAAKKIKAIEGQYQKQISTYSRQKRKT